MLHDNILFDKWSGVEHTPPLQGPPYRANMRKLATRLLMFDAPTRFDMGIYFRHPKDAVEYDCNTVACALGHAPLLLGIPINEDMAWHNYCAQHLIPADRHFSPRYTWCFSGAWTKADNTPQGAGMRILYMLQHGAPVVPVRELVTEDAKYIYWKEELA